LKKEEITRITEQFLYLRDMKCDGCLEDFKIGENVIKLDCKVFIKIFFIDIPFYILAHIPQGMS